MERLQNKIKTLEAEVIHWKQASADLLEKVNK